MPTPPTIRNGTAADLDVIVEFNRRLAWETEHKRLDPDVLRPGVATAWRPDWARYFIAECGMRNAGSQTSESLIHIPHSELRIPHSIVGQMMITYEWSDWRNGLFWWIQSVYVRQDARRGGVFRSLYQHVETLARATPNACGLRLYVEHENAAAIATYVKLGMVPSGHLLYECDWSGATTNSS